MPRNPSAFRALLLALPLAACASKATAPLVVVSQPAPPPVSAAQAELFRCPPPPKLAPGAEAYEDVEALALQLRDAYDTCADLGGRLITLVTHPARAAPVH